MSNRTPGPAVRGLPVTRCALWGRSVCFRGNIACAERSECRDGWPLPCILYSNSFNFHADSHNGRGAGFALRAGRSVGTIVGVGTISCTCE
jgi:hypothetical protein